MLDTMRMFFRFLDDKNISMISLVERLSWAEEFQDIKIYAQSGMDQRALQNLLNLSDRSLPPIEKFRYPKTQDSHIKRVRSTKARILLVAHLERLHADFPEFLQPDFQYCLLKVPVLIEGMLAAAQSRMCSYRVLTAIMHLSQMLIQALASEHSNPLEQVPHMTRLLADKATRRQGKGATKKQESLPDFLFLNDCDALRTRLSEKLKFTPEQIDDIIQFRQSFPLVKMTASPSVLGESVITANALVTIDIVLERVTLKDVSDDTARSTGFFSICSKLSDVEGDGAVSDSSVAKKLKGKSANVPASPISEDSIVSPAPTDAAGVAPSGVEEDQDESADDSDLMFLLKQNKKKKISEESKSRLSHPVHCSFFPGTKYEHWWVFVTTGKDDEMRSEVKKVTGLFKREDIQLRIQALKTKGTQTFRIHLVSDSYVGIDQSIELKFVAQEDLISTAQSDEHDLAESSDDKEDSDSSDDSDLDNDSQF